MSDDLASGFQDVDNAADFAVYASCLTLVESLPFFAEVKRASYDMLGAAPGRRVLDVGCGLGDDAAALAGLVAPGGSVVGVDGSRAMIEAARARHGAVEGLSFEVADAASLPFGDATFASCRIDRVLQHVADPAPAVLEMARVLRPGGVLVAYDNVWETLTVSPGDRGLTRTVLNAWCDRFPSGWIGRQLLPHLLQAGLDSVSASPRTLILRDLSLADRLYLFFATTDRLASAGVVDRDEVTRWSDGLRAADTAGRFFSSYTGFLVCGTRPGGDGSAT
jgi:ubiquinone/menaquinone biosynthesis C-methylase UbiE